MFAPLPRQTKHSRDAAVGLVNALAAYSIWALMPVYFKLVAQVPPLLVLAHRIVWSFLLLAVLIALSFRTGELRAAMRSRRIILMLSCSTVLLAINWGTFIYAVAAGRVLQASLGYFIVPLVSAALGVGVLRERLTHGQLIALIIAAIGVVIVAIARGTLPWIALTVTFSWSGYALVRKVTQVSPLIGVTIETALLVPFAAAFIFAMHSRASAAGIDLRTHGILMLSSVVTAAPLLCFTAAARRLRFITLGFLQYITPTGQFLLAVFAYREPFGPSNLLGFAFIWTALIVYSIDSLRAYRTNILVVEGA